MGKMHPVVTLKSLYKKMANNSSYTSLEVNKLIDDIGCIGFEYYLSPLLHFWMQSTVNKSGIRFFVVVVVVLFCLFVFFVCLFVVVVVLSGTLVFTTVPLRITTFCLHQSNINLLYKLYQFELYVFGFCFRTCGRTFGILLLLLCNWYMKHFAVYHDDKRFQPWNPYVKGKMALL